MNHQTVVATKYVDNKITILAECYQYDKGKNEWHKFNQVQTWRDWSEDWFNFVDGDVARYGYKMYRLLSRIVIEPLHTIPAKPMVDREFVDWSKVGEVIRSHFET